MNWSRSNELTCKTLWRGIGTLSAPAGWLLWLWGKSGPSVKSWVWSASKLFCLTGAACLSGQFLSRLRDGFLPSDDEGVSLLQGQGEGPEFSRCRQDPGHLGRNLRWCSQLCAHMTIRKPSRKYSHNHPVPSCHSQSCWRKYPLDLLSEKLSEVSEPPPSCKHLGKDHGLFFLLLLLFFHLFLLVGG